MCIRDRLGTVGEPISSETWLWYRRVVGDERLPIVDTWWQTETGGHMIAPLPGATPLKPSSATFPFFGVVPVLLDAASGEVVKGEGSGCLCFAPPPWPGMFHDVFGAHERYVNSYFNVYEGGFFFSGDGARRDDGYLFLSGRLDDVMSVSGHRIGTAEVESALVQHRWCIEAAVVSIAHEIKGETIVAFAKLDASYKSQTSAEHELIQNVRKEIGPFAAPGRIIIVKDLPKTRSGKIMRRILKKIAARNADDLGDVSALADPSVVDDIIDAENKSR